MISKKSDDAISPVIGVMLMLVVTVVIAAAVTIFATGVVGETEAAPVAVLDVEILSSVEALEGMNGPELFITHLSGEAVDTEDIELRFSWNCGVDGCTYGGTHYSTHSAEEMSKHIDNGVLGKQYQPLYVKSTMEVQKENPKYGTTGGMNHYFGDVILTPGLKLTAHSEFLPGYDNTDSPFMDVIFDNYDVTSGDETSTTSETTFRPYTSGVHPNDEDVYISSCEGCVAEKGPNGSGWGCYDVYLRNEGITVPAGYCVPCYSSDYHHLISECNTEQCICKHVDSVTTTTHHQGIMEHLPAGTAVDVMIIHIPSGKAIYDNTVIVQ